MSLLRLAGLAGALLIGLTLARPTLASDAGRKTGRRARFAQQLPKGWRLDPGTPPLGLELVAVGPPSKAGRAYVTLRRWPRGQALAPRTPLDAERLAARAGVEGGFTRIQLDGPGGPVLDAPARGGLAVRYVLHPRGLLTIAAPPRLLRATYTWVLKAVARLPPTS